MLCIISLSVLSICLFIHLHAHTLFPFDCFYIIRCIPAFPPVSASARNAFCIFYEYKGEFCKNVTRSLYVYGDQSTLDTGEREAVNFKGYFDALEITPECRIPFKDLFCVYGFPNCDESLAQPKSFRVNYPVSLTNVVAGNKMWSTISTSCWDLFLQIIQVPVYELLK